MNNLQKPLHHLLTEQSLLASLMSIEDGFNKVSEIICEDDFSFEPHRLIFRAIKVVYEQGHPVDNVTVHDQLERSKTLHSAGGDSCIAVIMNVGISTLFNLEYNAERIKELSQQRRIRSVLVDAHSAINDDGNDVDVKVSNIVSELLKVSANDNDADNQSQSISDLIGGFLDKQYDLIKGIKPKSQKTGFFDLDDKAPIQNGNLIVLAARPAMGKTTLGLNKLSNMIEINRILDKEGDVISEKLGVIFSLEMTKDEIMEKYISAAANVDLKKIKDGKLDEDDWSEVQKVITKIKKGYPLHIDDRPKLTFQQIRSRLIQLKSQGHEIGVVVVDYLQIMGGLDANNMTNSLAEVTGNFKALAKELNCPVILLSQLNRELEKRPNKRPINSDLRSSGSIEQDADIIIFVYRDEVYNENSEHKGVAEIIIGKNRHGEIGTVRLGFEGAKSKFTNFMPQYDEDGHPFHA